MSDLSVQTAHIATQQEKLDAVFGITGGKSIDEFLDGLSLDSNAVESTMQTIDSSIKSELSSIDCTSTSNVQLQLSSMEDSLERVESMVELSKDVLRHVAESILATPLIDSEAVQAYSKLMESIHISIAEFIELYKGKQNFVNKVRFAMLQQEQKKELIYLKHKLDLEKIHAQDNKNAIEAETTDMSTWKQEDILKMLKNAEQHDDND